MTTNSIKKACRLTGNKLLYYTIDVTWLVSPMDLVTPWSPMGFYARCYRALLLFFDWLQTSYPARFALAV